jgi:hypothetical protein
VHSLPSFIDQGIEAHASSVADIVEIECNPSEYDGKIRISDVELYDRCAKNLSWSPTNEFKSTEGPATEATLDDDGSATVVLWGGPNCKPGETQIVVDQVGYPNETYMTPFTVLPPEETAEGVYALPASQVEDSVNSSVATIVEVEFPSIVESKVAVDAEQLFARCKRAPHAIWVGPDEELIKGEGRIEGESALETDDDGNAFVVLLGASSCQPGKVLISASLEEDPFTTLNTTFTIESPRPTFIEAFKVEKEQKIGAGSFTKEKLIGKLGETVDYRIVVTNTGDTTLDLANITDPNCTNIKLPAKAEIGPGEKAEYTCEHELSTIGVWTNVAQVETSTHQTGESNEVEAEALGEALAVEKEQKLPGGSFTKAKLEGKLGEIVDYRVIVTNTGNLPITLASITDPNCTNILGPSQSTLAPKEHAEYTCEHELTTIGVWTNVATVETTSHKSGESNKVEVEVTKKAITVEKEQKLPGGTYTKTPPRLIGKPGEVVSYKIVVTNVGTGSVTLEKITDEHCQNLKGPSNPTLAAGEQAEYFCEHELTEYGVVWANVAEAETTSHLTEKSNIVEVETPEIGTELFEVQKEQKVGTGAYTKSKLVANVGETIDYRIVVTNTGRSVVNLTGIKDTNCVNVVGPAQTRLGLGESTYYTCEHPLTGAGIWTNEAMVESTHQVEQSNKVEAEASEIPGPEKSKEIEGVVGKQVLKAVCALNEPAVKLVGGAGSKRKPFTVSVVAVGIGQLTVYLDGHKLKTLKHSQARNGRFSIRIDPQKLSHGPHKILVKVDPTSGLCGKFARSAVFVHPKSSATTPVFTG